MVVPYALYISWVESPGYFSCESETIQDLINYHVDNKTTLPYNPVKEQFIVSDVPNLSRVNLTSKLLQVYVDNFCNATIDSKDRAHIPSISR